MAAYVPASLLQIVRAFVDPRGYIGGQSATYENGTGTRIRRVLSLSAIYVLGLLLYALPLTYAGFGMTAVDGDPPAQIVTTAAALGWEPSELWVFLRSFVENTVFLISGSIVTLCVFHGAVIVLRTSRGFLQSVHTIVYASGMYLAAVYSFVWALSISDSVAVADQVVLAIQSAFITAVIDFTGTNVALPGGDTTMPDTAAMTSTGSVLLVGLAVSIVYLLYSLYAGVRSNHGGSGFQAIGTVVLVLSAPVLYVLGSIVATVFQIL